MKLDLALLALSEVTLRVTHVCFITIKYNSRVWLSILGAWPQIFARILSPSKWGLSVLSPLPTLPFSEFCAVVLE